MIALVLTIAMAGDDGRSCVVDEAGTHGACAVSSSSAVTEASSPVAQGPSDTPKRERTEIALCEPKNAACERFVAVADRGWNTAMPLVERRATERRSGAWRVRRHKKRR